MKKKKKNKNDEGGFCFFHPADAWFEEHLPIRLSRKQDTSGTNAIMEG